MQPLLSDHDTGKKISTEMSEMEWTETSLLHDCNKRSATTATIEMIRYFDWLLEDEERMNPQSCHATCYQAVRKAFTSMAITGRGLRLHSLKVAIEEMPIIF